MQYLEKLEDVERRYEELTAQMADPEVIGDAAQYRKISKQQSDLVDVVNKFREWKTASKNLAEARVMLAETDPDLQAMAQEEIAGLEPDLARYEEELKILLLPKDPNDDKNVVLEIRAGTGGDEASLFAGDLFRMYERYAAKQGWKTEIMTASEGTKGGYKEIVAEISGRGPFAKLKFESGVHRVQRVPDTETQGRIHTSAATVAVLPEAEEVDIEIKPDDLKIDTMRSQGAGGQHVNKTESAIRITHIPSGVVVMVQEERSQHKNRAKAMAMLRSKLYEAERTKLDSARAADRKEIGRAHV